MGRFGKTNQSIAHAIVLRTQGQMGQPELESAVNDVYRIVDLSAQEKTIRKQRWKTDQENNTDTLDADSVAKGFNDPPGFGDYEVRSVPEELVSDFIDLAEQNYMLNPDYDAALDLADRQIRSVWTRSRFGSEDTAFLAKNSPSVVWRLNDREAFENLQADMEDMGYEVESPPFRSPFMGDAFGNLEEDVSAADYGGKRARDRALRIMAGEEVQDEVLLGEPLEPLEPLGRFELRLSADNRDRDPLRGNNPYYYIYRQGSVLPMVDETTGIPIQWAPDDAYDQHQAKTKSDLADERKRAEARRPIALRALEQGHPMKFGGQLD